LKFRKECGWLREEHRTQNKEQRTENKEQMHTVSFAEFVGQLIHGDPVRAIYKQAIVGALGHHRYPAVQAQYVPIAGR
jgi:hypothetical protein